MIDRVKLRKQYKEETGEHWKMFYSTAQPTVEYTKWLEDRLVKNCYKPDVVWQSEQLRAFKRFLLSEYHLPISNRMVDEFEQKQSSLLPTTATAMN